MMLPVSGSPTRNFQAGKVLADKMIEYKRCPHGVEEFVQWCEKYGLKRGALEGINSLNYWPNILKKYSIPLNNSSMINLLYMCVIGPVEIKKYIYDVMSSSRELANYCQESVKSLHSKKISNALNNFHLRTSIEFVTNSLTDKDQSFFHLNEIDFSNLLKPEDKPIYNKVIDYIETYLKEFNL